VEGAHPALTLVLALAVGILAQAVARHVRVPGIVILLVAGVALGPDGLGWVQPLALGDGLFVIVDLAVAVILFEGGLNLEISRLRREQAPIRRLVSVGALVTMVGGALTVAALFDWSWMRALLFGSLVVVTGPTVIGPLVDAVRLRPRVATVLEAEGVLIDPIGAILAVLMLEVALAPGADSLASGATGLVLRLGFGAVAGIVAGFVLAGLLRVRRVVPEGFENVFALASVLLLFQGCDVIVPHSGVLAVAVAGVVVGNVRTRVDRDLREFKDQLSVLLIGLLFILLAATVRIADVRALGWNGLAVVAVLVFAVRPANVWLCTVGSELTRKERWFIAGVAPRGIVAAAVAALAAGALDSHGLAGGAELRALVFLTIAAAGPRHGRDSRGAGARTRVGRGAAQGWHARRVPGLQPRQLPPGRGSRLHRGIRRRGAGTHAAARAPPERRRGDRAHAQPDAEQRLRQSGPRALRGAAGLRRGGATRVRARVGAGRDVGRRRALRRSARHRALGRALPTRIGGDRDVVLRRSARAGGRRDPGEGRGALRDSER
jgi:NhaP-type Na+/H+ or K+/H+ antiporter